MSKLFTSAGTVALSMMRDLKGCFRDGLSSTLNKMGFVKKEEFDAMKKHVYSADKHNAETSKSKSLMKPVPHELEIVTDAKKVAASGATKTKAGVAKATKATSTKPKAKTTSKPKSAAKPKTGAKGPKKVIKAAKKGE